jgi:thiosulfate reductase cytochrome b subunit
MIGPQSATVIDTSEDGGMKTIVKNERWKGKRAQPWLIRLTHWLNVPLLIIIAASGLQILLAYPALGPRGAQYGWYPWQGMPPPAWARLGGWLAGGRHWHFALGWFLLLNGMIYTGGYWEDQGYEWFGGM